MSVRRVTFVLDDAPLAGARARERLDLVLMGLAFDLEVSVLFMGDGVWQLVNPDGAGDARGFVRAYRSLELYGVSGIYAAAEALDRRGISDDRLLLPVERLDAAGIRALLARQEALW